MAVTSGASASSPRRVVEIGAQGHRPERSLRKSTVAALDRELQCDDPFPRQCDRQVLVAESEGQGVDGPSEP
ncbi:hypothetical protein DEU32_105184 [Curtobacterium sp. AG1037]|nr:hypothetical protein DEU32_105184 [Curtobacterium sp. AG1037]TQJ26831.1 hypothetical protein FB462_0675 [Curtobacterium citreum]